MKRLDLREVLEWIDPVQFAMGEQVLQEAGIPSDQHGRTINSLEDPASVFMINRIRLRVRAEDLERARDLLRQTVGRGVIEDPQPPS